MKIFFTITATLIGNFAFLPYIKDILSLRTKPHAYSWLIWAVTLGIGAAGIWWGGGGWGGLSLVIGFFFVIVIFLFSLKYGSKNIRRSDTAVLIIALLAVLASWQVRQPFLAVIMASAMDFLGYVPSFRKSYAEPWSETPTTWVAFAISNGFSLLALREYHWITTAYLVTLTVANTLLSAICFLRRPFVSKPAAQ